MTIKFGNTFVRFIFSIVTIKYVN